MLWFKNEIPPQIDLLKPRSPAGGAILIALETLGGKA
jgi:hypothetical protein